MGKAVCLIRKIVQLVALGYGNWVIYRTLRYARSFLVPREVASPSTEKISREQAQYFIQELNGVFQVSNSRALCLHLYYTDVLPEILASPLFVQEKCDLYISVGPEIDGLFFKKLKSFKGRVKVYQFANKGRDIFPFLKIYPELLDANYEWVCKLHSKRSPQIRDGELWRQDLFADLLSLDCRQRLDVGRSDAIIAPKFSLLPVRLFLGANGPMMLKLLEAMRFLRKDCDFLFVSGSMFWFRPASLKKLLKLENLEDYFHERYQIDGNTEHAFERLFYFLATESSV